MHASPFCPLDRQGFLNSPLQGWASLLPHFRVNHIDCFGFPFSLSTPQLSAPIPGWPSNISRLHTALLEGCISVGGGAARRQVSTAGRSRGRFATRRV